MKIVKLKSVKYDTVFIAEVCEGYQPPQGYIQLSEIIDVDFPELQNEEVVRQEIIILDEMEKEIMAESQVKLNSIKQRKQELLALPRAN